MATKESVETSNTESDLTTETVWSGSLQQSIGRDGGLFSKFRFVAVHLDQNIELLGNDDYQTLKSCLLSDYGPDFRAGLISIIGQ